MLWSPKLKTGNRVSNDLMHSCDWLPTLAEAAGIKIPSQNRLDGMSMWRTLTEGRPGLRYDVLHNADPKTPYTSYMFDNWKYVKGTVNPSLDSWLGDIPKDDNPNAGSYLKQLFSSPAWKALRKQRKKELSQNEVKQLRNEAQVMCKHYFPVLGSKCDPNTAPCLFNLKVDPCERFNFAPYLPEIINMMEEQLSKAMRRVVYPINQPLDPRSDPGLYNGTWTYWMDIIEERMNMKYNV